MFSVSYYVPAERYWQFSGEFENIADAERQAEFLIGSKGIDRVRLRKGSQIIRTWES